MAFITDCDSIAPIPMMGQIDIQSATPIIEIMAAEPKNFLSVISDPPYRFTEEVAGSLRNS